MSAAENILVSVVIPVKNGSYWLRETLAGIQEQEIEGQLEIIVIDSGSTDNSLEIIRNFKVRIIQIDPAEFNHGLTRNLGVEMARGEFIVMTVQDARPADRYWIQKMLIGFSASDVAGVCGAQVVPHDPDKNPVEWFRPVSEPQIVSYRFPESSKFDQLSPDEKRKVCAWDNVTAMYRKQVLQKIPFRKTDFAEDALWASEAAQSGYRLVYNPAARVYHYHHESDNYAYRRTLTTVYHFYQFFGWLPILIKTDFRWHLRLFLSLVRSKEIGWRRKWYWFGYNLQLTRAINQGISDIKLALQSGGMKAVENLYKKHCAAVPQAPAKTYSYE